MRVIPWITGAILAVFASTVFAAGTGSDSTRSEPDRSAYEKAVSAVKAENYSRARDLLEDVVEREPRNADAWNWLGFSERNLGNYDASLAAYEKALAIEPEHRGALEYLGELYLQTGEVQKAKAQLEKLDEACGILGCEEYDELEAAIEKQVAGG